MVPEGWENVPLSETVSSQRNSFAIGPFGSDLVMSDYRAAGVPVVFVRDIKRNSFNWKSEVYVTEEKAKKLRAHSVKAGDIVITKMGLPPGVAAVYPDNQVDGVVTADIIRMKVDSDMVNSKFLCELLNSHFVNKQVYQRTAGQTRPKLTLADYKSIRVGIPPLPEQKKIAKILSTWDKAITTTEQLLANSQQQKKALMQQLLTGKKRFPGFGNSLMEVRKGYAKSKLGELPSGWKVEVVKNYFWYQEGPGVRNHQFTESGVKLFNGTNIQFNRVDLFNTTTCISEEEAFGPYKHFLVEEGDLVIACSGISVDRFDEKIGFIDKNHLPLCMNTSTMRFRVLDENKADINYFKYFMMSSLFKNQIRRQITGSAQLNFGPSHVGKCFVVLPSLEEQRKIASALIRSDGEIDTLHQKVIFLKQEKKTLMQQLLTGKRRVKLEAV